MFEGDLGSTIYPEYAEKRYCEVYSNGRRIYRRTNARYVGRRGNIIIVTYRGLFGGWHTDTIVGDGLILMTDGMVGNSISDEFE